MQFRDSEDGEVLYTLYENRRNSTRRLPKKPYDPRSYDERQIAPKGSSAATDVQGQAIDGP